MSEAQHLAVDVDRAGPRRHRSGYTTAHPAGLGALATGAPDPAPCRVYLYARDTILREGVSTQLRYNRFVDLHDAAGVDPSGVAIIVADELHGEVLSAIGGVRRACTPRIVVLATRVTPLTSAAAIDAGAWYILRRADTRPGGLVAAVRRAARAPGPPSDPGEMLGDLVDRLDEDTPVRAPRPAGLSARDVEVLRLLADGRNTADIADGLAYSESTIKNTVHAIIRLLGARNRAHAVAMAIRSGLI